MRYCISSLAILLFFSACADNSKSEQAVFEGTTKSLEQSNKMISDISADYRKQLFDRLHDLRTKEQAAVWQPKAARVSELALSTIGYINTLKSQLVGEGDNFQVVNKIFFRQNKGKELYLRLKNFVDSIYAGDYRPDNQFTELRVRFDYVDSSQYNDKKFTETFFKKVSSATALSMLAKFENDILIVENKVITYCYYHIGVFSCGMDYFYPLISVSSVCVKAGESIEITTGIGSFSKASQPNVTIDGKSFLTDENGVIAYKFKTPLKAGIYNKDVKLEYTKPDGTKESITKNIEYTVIEPNQNPQ